MLLYYLHIYQWCRYLDKEGFAAIGYLREGTQYADRIYQGYGEGGSGDGSDGKGPAQGRINQQGNAYLDAKFPKLGRIVSAIATQ